MNQNKEIRFRIILPVCIQENTRQKNLTLLSAIILLLIRLLIRLQIRKITHTKQNTTNHKPAANIVIEFSRIKVYVCVGTCEHKIDKMQVRREAGKKYRLVDYRDGEDR